MEKLTVDTAEKLLLKLRNFIVDVILKDDQQSQFEVKILFDQLHNLFIDYKQRQGG